MPFEEFVVVNRTEHKVQCAKLNAQRLKGFVPFKKFVVQRSRFARISAIREIRSSKYHNSKSVFEFILLFGFTELENRVKNSWSQNHRKSFAIR